MKPRYPDIEVKLTGEDGNAYAIMAAVRKALKAADVPQKEIDQYLEESQAGDYNDLVVTAMKWVEVT